MRPYSSDHSSSSEADTTILLNPTTAALPSIHVPTTVALEKDAADGREPTSVTRITAALCYALSSIAIQV